MENFFTRYGIKKINELAIRRSPTTPTRSVAPTPARTLSKPTTPTVSKKSQDPVKPTMGPPLAPAPAAAPAKPAAGPTMGPAMAAPIAHIPPPQTPTPQTPTATKGDLDAVSRGPGRQGDVLGSKADTQAKIAGMSPTFGAHPVSSARSTKIGQRKAMGVMGSVGKRLIGLPANDGPKFPGMKGTLAKSVGPDRTRPPEGAVKPIDLTRADVPMGDKERAVMGMSQTPSPAGRGEEKPPTMPGVVGRSSLGRRLGSLVRSGMHGMETQHAKDKELDQRRMADVASKAKGEKTGALLPGDPGGPPATPASPPSMYKKMIDARKARAQGIKHDYASNWTPDGEFSLGSSRKEIEAKEKSTFGDPTVLTPTQKKMATAAAALKAKTQAPIDRAAQSKADRANPTGKGNAFLQRDPDKVDPYAGMSTKERIRARLNAPKSTTPRTSQTVDRLRMTRRMSGGGAAEDLGDDEQ